MKLIIQIPCYNEAESIEQTINSIPDKINGVDEIEILAINDGSTDNTLDILNKLGVKIVSHQCNLGLARAFKTGLNESLKLGADIIVNTDADNQYNAYDIEKIITPIILNNADIVIGSRPIWSNKEFPLFKKILSVIGSFVVRILSKTNVWDAVSGFRAFSKNAATQFEINDNYTYTIETIFQSKAKNLRIKNIPIHINSKCRESKLIKNIPNYIFRQSKCIIRNYFKYYSKEFIIILLIILLFIFFITKI